MAAGLTRGVAICERPRILFRVAAGPRIGSGHLVRSLRLAALTGLPTVFSLRGDRAGHLQVRSGRVALAVKGGARAVMRAVQPALVVVDDPSARAASSWIAAARRHDCPVVGVVDGGIGATNSDLVIDGSVVKIKGSRPAGRALRGAAYAVVDPSIGGAGSRPRRASTAHVFISLGGGVRTRYARRLAEALSSAYPTLRIVVAGGFVGQRSMKPTASKALRIQWLGPQRSLAPWLASASVAVVAGGITLYEACALGVPTVAVPIVPPQKGPVRAMRRLGAVTAPPLGARIPAAISTVVPLVGALLDHPNLTKTLTRRARAIVDGRGAFRVSKILRALAMRTRCGTARETSTHSRRA